MPLGNDSVIVQVVIPREYMERLDKMQSPALRSRSAVIRRIIEEAIGHSFSLPVRSVDGPDTTQAEQPAKDIAA